MNGGTEGEGSVSPDDALNYHLRIKLESGGVGGVATQAMGLLGGAVGSSVKSGIPVAITGTPSKPIFAPEMGQIFGGSGQKQTTQPKKSLGEYQAGY